MILMGDLKNSVVLKANPEIVWCSTTDSYYGPGIRRIAASWCSRISEACRPWACRMATAWTRKTWISSTKHGICLLVPCYNYQNGYYSSNIVLYYDDKMRDLGACTKFFNDVYVEIDEMRSILDKKISSSHDIPITQGRDYLELVQSGRDLGSESDSVPCATCVHGAVSRKQVEHVLSFWNPPCKNQYFDDFDCSCDIGYDCKVASDLMMSGNLCKGFERSSEKQEEEEE